MQQHIAALKGYENCVVMLLKHACNVNIKGTPFHKGLIQRVPHCTNKKAKLSLWKKNLQNHFDCYKFTNQTRDSHNSEKHRVSKH